MSWRRSLFLRRWGSMIHDWNRESYSGLIELLVCVCVYRSRDSYELTGLYTARWFIQRLVIRKIIYLVFRRRELSTPSIFRETNSRNFLSLEGEKCAVFFFLSPRVVWFLYVSFREKLVLLLFFYTSRVNSWESSVNFKSAVIYTDYDLKIRRMYLESLDLYIFRKIRE